ncbi:hypothetical protein DZA09_12960, partial [Pseudomonas aeruginosa]
MTQQSSQSASATLGVAGLLSGQLLGNNLDMTLQAAAGGDKDGGKGGGGKGSGGKGGGDQPSTKAKTCKPTRNP